MPDNELNSLVLSGSPDLSAARAALRKGPRRVNIESVSILRFPGRCT